jgi:subtilisin family serine protease
MKHIKYILFFILLSSVNTFGQTINKNRVDGAVYIKVAENVNLPITLGNAKTAKANFSFLNQIADNYQFTNISLPFASTNSKELQRTLRVDFSEIDEIESLLKELSDNPDIEYAEPVPLFHTSYVEPDDTYYNKTLSDGNGYVNSSWHLNLINAADAWMVTEGDPAIVVAVIDNAIWIDHPDLTEKIVKSFDVADGDNNPNPPALNSSWSHGTHVAGLVAASTGNGKGVASIGKNISLMAIKAANDNEENPRNITSAIEGIIWAADNGAHIINMSFGTTETSRSLQEAVYYAYNKGCILVAAAGNDKKDQNNYPAAFEPVISVASCDENKSKSSFSNFGNWVDIMAPGGQSSNPSFSMLSTYCGASNVTAFGVEANYSITKGTSMATPVTSGVCGLLLSINPYLTSNKVLEILQNTAENVDDINSDYIGKLGAGIINAYGSVQAAESTTADLVANFTVTKNILKEGNSIQFNDTSTGSVTSWNWEFEGGTPATSTDKNPIVKYDAVGTFYVKLTVSDGTNTSYEEKNAFIIVSGAGSNWIEQHLDVSEGKGVYFIDIVDEETVWAMTIDEITGKATKEFSVTTNGGTIWKAGNINIDSKYEPCGISAIDGLTAWLIAFNTTENGGKIFKTSDSGESWTIQPTASFSSANSFPNVIKMFNQNEGVCIGDPIDDKFEIYTTSNGGENWNLINPNNIPNILSGEAGWTKIFSSIGDNIWFGTNKGRIFCSKNKGVSWEAFSTGASDINSISFADENNGIILCYTPWKAQKTINGGKTWEDINYLSANPLIFSQISAVPGTTGMLIGIRATGQPEYNHSAYSFDNGETWNLIDSRFEYTHIKMYNNNIGWAGSYTYEGGGGIYKFPGLNQSKIEIPYNEDSCSLIIYPIPANDILNILNYEAKEYEIIDITGKIIEKGKIQNNSIKISTLKKGYYFLKLYEAQNLKFNISKFVKF